MGLCPSLQQLQRTCRRDGLQRLLEWQAFAIDKYDAQDVGFVFKIYAVQRIRRKLYRWFIGTVP
jgi:hypothetical protein